MRDLFAYGTLQYKGYGLNLIRMLFLILLLIFGGGCKSREKVFTIGIGIHVSVHLPILEGFKAGMAELGYEDGWNIRYIYDGILGSKKEVIDTRIKGMLSNGADLLLTTGNEVSLIAKKAVEGTGIPIVMAACSNPEEDGLVKSLSHPGENVTGVKVIDTMPRLLEVMVRVLPSLKKAYMPYNPDDNITNPSLERLVDVASQLGFKLVLKKVSSAEEVLADIESRYMDMDAILIVPSPTLDVKNNELSQAAIKHCIPMGSASSLDESMLITLGVDLFQSGKQAARMAHQIIHGTKAMDLPVETSEILLTINFKTAQKIGLYIPDDILIEANKIIR